MPYNEEDTKLHFITPALTHAGWTGSRITMEYPITAGQIVLRGDGHQQLPPRKLTTCYATPTRCRSPL